MITEKIQEPKKLQTILNHSNWNPPSKWEDWNFLDMVACPNFDEWKAKAPVLDRECPKCGGVEKWDAISISAMQNLVCEKCLLEYQRGQSNPEQIKKIAEKVESLIPPLYRETDRGKLEKEHSFLQVSEAMAWEQTEKGKGLVLVGQTRAGKTRTLCLLMEKLIYQGKSIKAYFHGGFYDELVEVIRSDKTFRKWKAEIVKTDILIIDDLFSEKLTERGEASLFEIIDARICYHKPTLLTTQVTRNIAKKRFHSVERYNAFFARITEFFQVIKCGKPIQEEIKVE